MTAVAIGDPYATLDDLKAWLGIPDAKVDKDAELTRRLVSSSDDINRYCHRQFGRDEVASARTFRPTLSGIDTHDFWDATELAVIPYLGTTAGTGWDVTMLTLEPIGGIVDQVPGWPYNRICTGYSSGYGTHPLWTNLIYSASTVQVTAKWGWENVPASVNTACLLLASQDNKSKDAPFGVAGFGDYAVRIRANPLAEEKLKPYVYQGTGAGTLLVAT